VPRTIEIEVPRRSLGTDLGEALAAHGLQAEITGEGDSCTLVVGFAEDEQERLVASATHAIEAYLADRGLPLIVQRSGSRCVVRPPSN
jgi:hypothetical protein